MSIDKQTAVRRLTNRWREQCELYPTMREEIPLALYVRRNLPGVMRDGLLADYDRA
jgi:hypothetical protein